MAKIKTAYCFHDSEIISMILNAVNQHREVDKLTYLDEDKVRILYSITETGNADHGTYQQKLTGITITVEEER